MGEVPAVDQCPRRDAMPTVNRDLGDLISEVSSRRSHLGGLISEVSSRRSHLGGLISEISSRRSHLGGLISANPASCASPSAQKTSHRRGTEPSGASSSDG
jgi:hypothetical protein